MIFKDSGFVVNSFSDQEYFGDVCIINQKNQFLYKSKTLSLCLYLSASELMDILIQSQSQMQRCVNTALERNRELVNLRKDVKKSFLMYSLAEEQLEPMMLLYQVQNNLLRKYPSLRPSTLFMLPRRSGDKQIVEEVEDLSPGDPVFTTIGDDQKREKPKVDLPAFLQNALSAAFIKPSQNKNKDNFPSERTFPCLKTTKELQPGIPKQQVYESSVMKNAFMRGKVIEQNSLEEVKTQRKALRPYAEACRDDQPEKNLHLLNNLQIGSNLDMNFDQSSTPNQKEPRSPSEAEAIQSLRMEAQLRTDFIADLNDKSEINVTAGYIDSDVIFDDLGRRQTSLQDSHD